MRVKKQNVEGSVGIEIKPPEGFSIDGETLVKPRVIEKKKTDQEVMFDLFYTQLKQQEKQDKRLEQLEKQIQETIKMIEKVKAELNCEECGEKND